MTGLEQQLTTALQRLSEQYETEQQRRAEQVVAHAACGVVLAIQRRRQVCSGV